MRLLSIFLLVGSSLALAINVRAAEPFVATIQRTTKELDAKGQVTRTNTTHETVMRSSGGSVRREVRPVENGATIATPVLVTLVDSPSGRTYRLDTTHKTAFYHPSNFDGDPAQQALTTIGSKGQESQNYNGVPCANMTSVFHEDGKEIGKGVTCVAIGYGIVIHERAQIPISRTKSVLIWETDLLNFDRNREPPADLMRVPQQYTLLPDTRLPNSPILPK
jgi:hypothetical protein